MSFLLIIFLILTVSKISSFVPQRQCIYKASMLAATDDKSVLENLQVMIERRGRPAHVGLPRRRMELPFAVQLMRNSYNAADELDFVPMVRSLRF